MHIADFTKDDAGYVRYTCRCGHDGLERYLDDKYGSGHEHARRAFHLHALYSDRPRVDGRRA